MKYLQTFEKFIAHSNLKYKNILFHVTDDYMDILKDNTIQEYCNHLFKTKNIDNKCGVCLTRDKDYHRDRDVGFILDKDLLIRDGYKIIPIDYYYTRRNDTKGKFDPERKGEVESEEFVIGSILNLRKYLLGIRFNFTSAKLTGMKRDYPEQYEEFIGLTHGIDLYDPYFNLIQI